VPYLAPEDMANCTASYEDSLSYSYHGWTITRLRPGRQGFPVLLQALADPQALRLRSIGPMGEDFVHTVMRRWKLGLCGPRSLLRATRRIARSRWITCSRTDLQRRACQVDYQQASLGAASRRAAGFELWRHAYNPRGQVRIFGVAGCGRRKSNHGASGPKNAATPVHLERDDRWGATWCRRRLRGAGGQSNPVVPGLGFPLNSRAADVLARGRPCRPRLAPGRPPPDHADPVHGRARTHPSRLWARPAATSRTNWQFDSWFLRFVLTAFDLQEYGCAAVHSMHYQGSFFPREAKPAK